MKKILALLFCLLSIPAYAQIVNTLPFQLQNGTTADATQVMADFNQIVSNVNSNAANSGANSNITSLTGLTTPLGPTFGGSSVYTGGTSTGSANAQVVSTSPNGFTLTYGKRVVFIAGLTNTTAATLSINGTTATNVYYPTPSGPLPLVGGEMKSGNIVEAWFDGTQFQLITNNLSLLGPLTNLASATTADLGTVPTHNVNVTGGVTITSFGSTAITAYPIYYLTFAGAATLTYNATSLILPGQANITTAANDSAVAQYLGSGNWQIWSYQRASGATVVATTPLCGASGLSIKNNSGTPNTNIDIAATVAIVMNNSSGVSFTAAAPSTTINTTNIGVINGIQASRAINTFYKIYYLSNGTISGGFAVAQGTSLSAPAGYQYSCYLGSMVTDSSGNFMRTLQLGKRFQYTVVSATNTVALPAIVAGLAGSNCSTATPTYFSVSLTGLVPSTITALNMIVVSQYNGGGGSSTLVAPNASYSGLSSANPPFASTVAGTVLFTSMLVEASTIYYCASASGGAVLAAGWDDAVNAN